MLWLYSAACIFTTCCCKSLRVKIGGFLGAQFFMISRLSPLGLIPCFSQQLISTQTHYYRVLSARLASFLKTVLFEVSGLFGLGLRYTQQQVVFWNDFLVSGAQVGRFTRTSLFHDFRFSSFGLALAIPSKRFLQRYFHRLLYARAACLSKTLSFEGKLNFGSRGYATAIPSSMHLQRMLL